MNNEQIKVQTNAIAEKFLEHLQLPGNERIIFSGKFGTGKTTFLDEFFKSYKKEYFTVKLYPVHYSVASNEDIFEYIKFDILFQMLEQEEFGASIFSDKELAVQYTLENLHSIMASLLRIIPKIDKGYKQITGVMENLKKSYEDFKAQRNANELDPVMQFLKGIAMEKGSPYENNCITDIIKKKLEQVRKNGRKTVLLIDDFDRIDPEHTFRILNVLASQCDGEFCGGRKFSFDHTILVCDINNIRNTFHHRYGSDTDFTGYIDKFYSKQIFEFDIREHFRCKLNVFLSPLNNNNSFFYGLASSMVLLVINELIKRGEINLRQAHNWASLKVNLKHYVIGDIIMPNSDMSVILLGTLAAMLGEDELERIIDKYDALNLQYNLTDSDLRLPVGVLFHMISHDRYHFHIDSKSEYECDFEGDRYFCVSQKYLVYSIYVLAISKITDKNGVVERKTFPFWRIMKKAFEIRKYYIRNGMAV